MKAVRWLFVILFPLCVVYGDVIFDVPLDIEYSITKTGTYDRITIPGSFYLGAPGVPELPGVVFNYLLAKDSRLKDIVVIHEVWETIPGEYQLFPKQEEHIIGDEYEFAPPDPVVYGSDEFFPASAIVSARSGNLRGYQIAHVSIVPFRYAPQSGLIQVLRQLSVRIVTELREPGISPLRQTHCTAG